MTCISPRVGFASVEKIVVAICIDELAGTFERTIDVDARHMSRRYVASGQGEPKRAVRKVK
jgi:hypothetical protein